MPARVLKKACFAGLGARVLSFLTLRLSLSRVNAHPRSTDSSMVEQHLLGGVAVKQVLVVLFRLLVEAKEAEEVLRCDCDGGALLRSVKRDPGVDRVGHGSILHPRCTRPRRPNE